MALGSLRNLRCSSRILPETNQGLTLGESGGFLGCDGIQGDSFPRNSAPPPLFLRCPVGFGIAAQYLQGCSDEMHVALYSQELVSFRVIYEK